MVRSFFAIDRLLCRIDSHKAIWVFSYRGGIEICGMSNFVIEGHGSGLSPWFQYDSAPMVPVKFFFELPSWARNTFGVIWFHGEDMKVISSEGDSSSPYQLMSVGHSVVVPYWVIVAGCVLIFVCYTIWLRRRRRMVGAFPVIHEPKSS